MFYVSVLEHTQAANESYEPARTAEALLCSGDSKKVPLPLDRLTKRGDVLAEPDQSYTVFLCPCLYNNANLCFQNRSCTLCPKQRIKIH